MRTDHRGQRLGRENLPTIAQGRGEGPRKADLYAVAARRRGMQHWATQDLGRICPFHPQAQRTWATQLRIQTQAVPSNMTGPVAHEDRRGRS